MAAWPAGIHTGVPAIISSVVAGLTFATLGASEFRAFREFGVIAALAASVHSSYVFYQLVAFVAVAAEGSFTAASAKLHKSQPAVSKLIRNLEDEFGIELFDQDDRGRGYGTEAVAMLVQYLFDEEEARRVEGGTTRDNAAMRRVYGMTRNDYEGVKDHWTRTS